MSDKSKPILEFSPEDLKNKLNEFTKSIENADIKNLLNEDVERSRNLVVLLAAAIIAVCLFDNVDTKSIFPFQFSGPVSIIALIFALLLLGIFSYYYLLNANTDNITKFYRKKTLEESHTYLQTYLKKFRQQKGMEIRNELIDLLQDDKFIKAIKENIQIKDENEISHLKKKISNKDSVSCLLAKLETQIFSAEKTSPRRNKENKSTWWNELTKKEEEVIELAIEKFKSSPHAQQLASLEQIRQEKTNSLNEFQTEFDKQIKHVRRIPAFTVCLCIVASVISIGIKFSCGQESGNSILNKFCSVNWSENTPPCS